MVSVVVNDQIESAASHLKFVLGGGPNDVLDVAVTCDCSWSKRGYTAAYGVVVVISWEAGEVLDYEVLSLCCRACARWKNADKKSNAYKTFYAKHKDQCTMNHTGSSKAMESAGALRIWQRSVSKVGLRYTTVISDGDSNFYEALRDNKPYGEFKTHQ